MIGPVAQGLVGPRLLSEEEEETEPLRAETARVAAPLPEATHCDCLHAARVACRADLSEKSPSKYQHKPDTSIATLRWCVWNLCALNFDNGVLP